MCCYWRADKGHGQSRSSQVAGQASNGSQGEGSRRVAWGQGARADGVLTDLLQ